MNAKPILCLLCVISFVVWAGERIAAGVNFDQTVTNYIERAVSASTPQVAVDQLSVAIAEIERRRLTDGIVGIFFRYPTNDVGYWYHRLVDNRTALQALRPDASPLEVSNVMIRMHESLAVSDRGGSSVRCPEGISIYPNNVGYFWWGVLSALGIVVFLVWWAVADCDI